MASQTKKIKKITPKKEKLDLRFAVDQSFQLMGILSPDGKLLFANKIAIDMAGDNEKNLIGKYFWTLPWWKHSKDLQKKVKEGVKKVSKGEFVRFEATHNDPKGKVHYIDFSISPAKNKKGDVVFLVPEGRDITKRKKVEEELKQKVRELEKINKLMVARELKMVELKNTIKKLKK